MNLLLRVILTEWLVLNFVSIKVFAHHFGFINAMRYLLLLKWRMRSRNPFANYPQKALTPQERITRRHFTGIILLFEILQEAGYPDDLSYFALEDLLQKTGSWYFKLTLPKLTTSKLIRMSPPKRLAFIQKLSKHFFTARGHVSQNLHGEILYVVNQCYIDDYAKQFNISPRLAQVFCKADWHYFQSVKGDVHFERSNTLINDQKPCGFKITMRQCIPIYPTTDKVDIKAASEAIKS